MKKRIIALTGKGGTGKSAITTLMTKVLMQKEGKLLVVDADPAMGLANILGIQVPRTLEDLRLEIIKVARIGEQVQVDEIVSCMSRGHVMSKV